MFVFIIQGAEIWWKLYTEPLSLSSTFQNSSNHVNQGLWAGIQRFYQTDPSVLSPNITVLASKVRSEDFVLFTYHLNLLDMFKGDCDLVVKEVDFGSNMVSHVLPKRSALWKPLSDV